jgi:hypothetical protein
MGPPFPLSYRGGQLVVEYATVCFRSQEDCGPEAARATCSVVQGSVVRPEFARSRPAARSQTLATKRVSVVTPGSRIFLFHQPCGGQVEQRDLPHGPRPECTPPDKTKVFRLLVEISAAMSPCKTSPYAIIIARPADTATRRD